MVFQQSSGWIRAYRWCERFLDRVGIRAAREPTDLCTLVQGYGLAALVILGFLFMTACVGLAVYGLAVESIEEYGFYRSYYGPRYGLVALLNIPAIAFPATVILMAAGIALMRVMISRAIDWHGHRNPVLRGYSTIMRWAGLALVAAVAVVAGVIVLCAWLPGKAWELLRGGTNEDDPSPNLLQVFGSWLTGQLQGFCARIDVVAG